MFREGLLRARGQIAFILALVLSLGAIIWLESADDWGAGDDLLGSSGIDFLGYPEALRERIRADLATIDASESMAADRVRATLALANAVGLDEIERDEALDLADAILAGASEELPDPDLEAALISLAVALPEIYPRLETLIAD